MSLKPLFILFLSTGNAARSQLAEALLNARGSERFTARSAGCKPLSEVHPETLALLQAQGIATTRLHTKGWGEFLAVSSLLPIDVIITLSEDARIHCPPWPGEPLKVHWAVDDPLGSERVDVRDWKFRKCYTTLEARINALVRSRLPATPGELFMQLKSLAMVV